MAEDVVERVAKALWRTECEAENAALRRAKQPVPERWADPWHPSGCWVRQRKIYEVLARAALDAIGYDALVAALEECERERGGLLALIDVFVEVMADEGYSKTAMRMKRRALAVTTAPRQAPATDEANSSASADEPEAAASPPVDSAE